jgi:hypothetical protein
MPYNHSIKAASPSGTAYTGRADGMFSLNEQVKFKSSGLWSIAIAAPSAPTITTITGGDGQATIAFTTPSSLNGATITSYTVTSSGGQTATGTSSPITVTGLTSGNSYTYTVSVNTTNEIVTSNPSISTLLLTPLGAAYKGGFYGGQINVYGAVYDLIVSPKSTGECSGLKWGSYSTIGASSDIHGPAMSALVASQGAAFEVANFCENLTIGGYTDWYLPAIAELETLYYNLKPTGQANPINYGSASSAYAMPPEPVSVPYTETVPGITTAANFVYGSTEAFDSGTQYWASTESWSPNTFAYLMYFSTGIISMFNKPGTSYRGRAIRRSLVAPDAPIVGAAYGGGFYAGRIATNGHLYNLVVAPKASGEALKTWGAYGTTTGITSVIDGPGNTAALAALGTAYQAANFCKGLNSGAGLNGYTDWYMPAQNELEVLYYFLKPTTATNDTTLGANANAVLPEPALMKYKSGSPVQTSATGVNGFRDGEANAFLASVYWGSNEVGSHDGWVQHFSNGSQQNGQKVFNKYVRAIRRVLVY